MPAPPKPGNGILAVQSEGWFDLERTRALWETAFKAPHSIGKRTLWVDRPSAGIPYLYVRTGLVLSAALTQMGRRDEATRIRAQVDSIARATQLENVVANAPR